MRILTTIILLSIILYGCDNEIDLLDEQKSFPIAYCFLNPEDDSYYVSLTKSVNAATNAYDLVSQPSNVFYDTATVRLSAWDKDSLIWETDFAKSDFVKNPGIFPQASGYLYKSNHCINETLGVLEKTKHLKLEIQIPGSNDSLVSMIPLIRYTRFKRPAHGDITAYFVPNPFEIHLKSPDRNEYYKELSMTFNYKDIFENHEIDQEIEIVLAKYLYAPDGVNYHIEIPLERILNKLKQFIPPITSDIRFRRIGTFNLSVKASDEYFQSYRDAYPYSFDGTGLIWSNFEGQGIGLFAHYVSRTVENIRFGQKTIDSIALSSKTKDLGFVKWN